MTKQNSYPSSHFLSTVFILALFKEHILLMHQMHFPKIMPSASTPERHNCTVVITKRTIQKILNFGWSFTSSQLLKRILILVIVCIHYLALQ